MAAKRSKQTRVPRKRAAPKQTTKPAAERWPAVLGDLAKDTVTGFAGIVVARTRWLNGCVRLTLQPRATDKDGKPLDSACFDTEQVVAIGVGVTLPNSKPTGGPHAAPVQHPPVARR